ncbi:MAG: hypothetical protein WAR79_08870 [Melioribacteraceae bacterium]
MQQCDCLNGCPFFNDKMSIESGLGKIFKRNYCLGNFMECARHKVKVALGKESVPSNLYPNMIDNANKILLKANA